MSSEENGAAEGKPKPMFPAHFITSPVNTAAISSHQGISAMTSPIPVLQTPMQPWNAIGCHGFDFGYDFHQHWMAQFYAHNHSGYSSEHQEYGEGDEQRQEEDEASQNACLVGPGPPIITSKKVKGPYGCNLFVFHLPNEITNWYTSKYSTIVLHA